MQFEPSYYEASVTRPSPTAPLTGDCHADVCVIGGGLTGISAALELAQRGRRVVLLEGKAVGWGASGRNGGQMLHGFSTSDLTPIAKQAGTTAKQLFDFSLEAIALLRQRLDTFSIACDLQLGYAEAAVKPRHFRALQQWAEVMAKEYDYPHARIVDAVRFRETIASRRYCGALLDDNSGHLHPLKYVLGLAAAARAAGAQIHENSPVVRIVKNGDLAVHTADGVVHCRRLLLACNAYDRELMPAVAARVMPVGTYIGATAPLGTRADNLIADKRSVCDTNFVLDYFRCSADTRLLFGGRVSYSTRPPADLATAMKRRMVAVFPQLADAPIEYAWGGFVAITLNRFPDIGRIGDSLYYAQGFSGQGVALTGFAGKIIADAMLGDEEKFDVFHRVRHRPFPGGRRFRTPLLMLAMLYYQLRDHL